jgi:hypothetical protein
MILLQGALGTSTIAVSPEPERPLLSIRLTVGESAINQFVEHLKKFGDARAFAVRAIHTRRDDKHVLVEMWRGDINISATNPFDDPTDFSLSVYKTGTHEISTTQIDALIEDLKGAIDKLDGVNIDAVKKRWLDG